MVLDGVCVAIRHPLATVKLLHVVRLPAFMPRVSSKACDSLASRSEPKRWHSTCFQKTLTYFRGWEEVSVCVCLCIFLECKGATKLEGLATLGLAMDWILIGLSQSLF